MDGQPESNMPSNFFEVGGIKKFSLQNFNWGSVDRSFAAYLIIYGEISFQFFSASVSNSEMMLFYCLFVLWSKTVQTY